MTPQDLIEIGRSSIDAFNTSDWDRFGANLTPDCVEEEVGTGRRLEGVDAIIENVKQWKTAFPDDKGVVTNAMASGNNVILELTWRGTQTGPLHGPLGTIPPTGRPVEVRSTMVMSFDGDRIKETHHYFDTLSILQQLGVKLEGDDKSLTASA